MRSLTVEFLNLIFFVINQLLKKGVQNDPPLLAVPSKLVTSEHGNHLECSRSHLFPTKTMGMTWFGFFSFLSQSMTTSAMSKLFRSVTE